MLAGDAVGLLLVGIVDRSDPQARLQGGQSLALAARAAAAAGAGRLALQARLARPVKPADLGEVLGLVRRQATLVRGEVAPALGQTVLPPFTVQWTVVSGPGLVEIASRRLLKVTW